MLHIATVHWRSDRWIDLQLAYFARHFPQPYRVYTFLTEVPGDHRDKFFYACTEPIEDHATKLNLLADVIRFNASDADDTIAFVDGDAFPIASLAPVLSGLDDHGLAAVQRLENNCEPQPHPSFCLTRVGFWTAIGGDWHRGHSWINPQGRTITDVGANLLRILEEAQVDWLPLTRLNKRNEHALFFGIYGTENCGPIAYHHGAGFRNRLDRIDFMGERLLAAERRVLTRLVWQLPDRGRTRRIRRALDPHRREKLRITEEVQLASEDMFSRIKSDPDFWLEYV